MKETREHNDFYIDSIINESTSSYLLATWARRFSLYRRVYKNYKYSLIILNPITLRTW